MWQTSGLQSLVGFHQVLEGLSVGADLKNPTNRPYGRVPPLNFEYPKEASTIVGASFNVVRIYAIYSHVQKLVAFVQKNTNKNTKHI